MDNLSIRDRMALYLEFKGISDYRFEKDLGLSKGYWNKAKNPTSEIVGKFVGFYTDISPEWLLRGNGEMTKRSTNQELSTDIYSSDIEAAFLGDENMKSAILQRIIGFSESVFLSKKKFAEAIGMEQTTVNNQLIGKRGLSIDLVLSVLASFPDISAEWLLRGNGNMKISEKDSVYPRISMESYDNDETADQSINERINIVMRECNYRSVNQLANKIGVARTSLNDIVKNNAEPKYSTISKILEAEPSISAEWLLRGKGEMTKQPTNQETPVSTNNSDMESAFLKKEAFYLRQMNERLDDLIKANETIENLKEEVESLKKQLELAEQDSNKMAVNVVKHKFA